MAMIGAIGFSSRSWSLRNGQRLNSGKTGSGFPLHHGFWRSRSRRSSRGKVTGSWESSVTGGCLGSNSWGACVPVVRSVRSFALEFSPGFAGVKSIARFGFTQSEQVFDGGQDGVSVGLWGQFRVSQRGGRA